MAATAARNTILGIDPGVTGGIAFLDPVAETLEVFDVPVLEAGTKSRRIVDEDAVWALIAHRAPTVTHAFIELVGVRPLEGAVGAFAFGMTTMALRMSVTCSGIPRTPVLPAVWKRRLGVPAAKQGAALRASQLMPKHAAIWTIKRLHCNQEQQAGRCEAALIAYFGHLKLSNGFKDQVIR